MKIQKLECSESDEIVGEIVEKDQLGEKGTSGRVTLISSDNGERLCFWHGRFGGILRNSWDISKMLLLMTTWSKTTIGVSCPAMEYPALQN